MTTLVVGASGATGRLLVQQLLEGGHAVRAIVRSPESLPAELAEHANLKVIHASLLDLEKAELAEHVRDCEAVVSCLGHRLTFKGVFGPPRRLVTDACHRLCEAVKANAPDQPVRFILMNTTGNRDPDRDEPRSVAEECVVGLLRMLVPPHADNEQAAHYLKAIIGPANPAIEWVIVRPDTLTDEDNVTAYDLHIAPIRSAIFNAGTTSRVNVAHFMAELATTSDTWDAWKGQMPVIYNTEK